jgi:guanosine-3',5'-bis(diphosphate) 3'-pyrophosphohydrolase
MNDILKLLTAVDFAADKHKFQRRKGQNEMIPYINHPLQIARLIAEHYGTQNTDLLVAAILHDIIEDTETTPEEIEEKFGSHVKDIVLEVSDDKNLNKADRKRLQVENSPRISGEGKIIKLADKICNVKDITAFPPKGWDNERIIEYIRWSRSVINGVKGVNKKMEEIFERVSNEAEEKYLNLV